jgi:mannose-6-phosphate isomerase-like protein (cupin superfamily)
MIDKITLRRLPVLDRPPATPVLDGVRILMAAGEAAPVFNGGPWRFVAYLEFLPGTGAWRGNHYHEKKRESFYVVKGRLRGVFEDLDTGERAELLLETGDRLEIEPRCAHAFAALEYAQVIECSPLEFDAADAFPRVIGSGPVA